MVIVLFGLAAIVLGIPAVQQSLSELRGDLFAAARHHRDDAVGRASLRVQARDGLVKPVAAGSPQNTDPQRKDGKQGGTSSGKAG